MHSPTSNGVHREFADDDSDAPTKDPLVGQVIQERFRVDKKLGQGGMGAIYLAEHLLLKKMVAIKCLHAGLASNPDVVRRFKNEAVAASSIGHPNIVEVMDMGRFEDGTFFMVLEFLDGKNWQDHLDAFGPQDAAKVAHLGVQICDALGAAAAKGIVHRDLKPDNIFLIERHGDDSFIKILDFGISKIHDGSGGATKTGELMGTPHYMSPEQVLGEEEITYLADMYALGVIFFQALSGSVPFQGNTVAQTLLKIATEPAPSLRERSPDLPDPLIQLVDEMIQKAPAARPQSFPEVAARLLPFVPEPSRFPHVSRDVGTATGGGELTNAHSAAVFGKTMLPQTISQGAAPAPGGVIRGKPPIWMLAVGAVVIAGIFGWFVSSGDDDAQPEDLAQAEEARTEPVAKANANEATEKGDNTVRLQISTVPSDAQLFLNGNRIENPFDRALGKDEKSYELLVKHDGFETLTRKIVLTSPQQIIIALSEEPDSAATQEKQQSAKAQQPAPKPAPAPTSQKSEGNTPKPLKDLERGLKKLF